MYYDAHTHLNDESLYEFRNKIIEKFWENNGKWLINVWINSLRNQRALKIAEEFKDNNVFVWAALGLHPGEVVFSLENKLDIDKEISEIKRTYKNNKKYIYAIGEWGIDNHYKWSVQKIDLQKYCFDSLCWLAQEFELPLVVHSRDWFEETIDVLKKYKNLKIYFHCWWYTKEEIKIVEKEFDKFWIGFTGNVSYPKAFDIRNSLESLDTDKILLETDAPYLAPQIKRGKTNTPLFLSYIYDYVSDFLSLDKEKFWDILKSNFKSFYF